MKQAITETITLPQGVQAEYVDGILTVKAKNELKRNLFRPKIAVSVDAENITLHVDSSTQREKKQLYTMKAHILNMIRGSQEAHTYKVKVCSGHFPMNVSISNGVLTVKNFLGEAVPRKLVLKKDVSVVLNGDIIEISSPYIERAGTQASDIEQLTKITNRDRRIFQDGLYIIEKDGNAI